MDGSLFVSIPQWRQQDNKTTRKSLILWSFVPPRINDVQYPAGELRKKLPTVILTDTGPATLLAYIALMGLGLGAWRLTAVRKTGETYDTW